MISMYVRQNVPNTMCSKYIEKDSKQKKTGRARANSRDLTGFLTQTLNNN